MLKAKITLVESDDVLLKGEFSDRPALTAWLNYHVPQFDVDALKINSKKTFGDYVVSLEAEAELPEADAEEPKKPGRSPAPKKEAE